MEEVKRGNPNSTDLPQPVPYPQYANQGYTAPPQAEGTPYVMQSQPEQRAYTAPPQPGGIPYVMPNQPQQGGQYSNMLQTNTGYTAPPQPGGTPYVMQSQPEQRAYTAPPQPGGTPYVMQGQPQQVAQYSNIQTNTNVVLGQAPVFVGQLPPFEDHTMRAILVTFFCFWPVGMFAIWNAIQAKDAWNRGDLNAAQNNSSAARNLSNVSIGIGTIIIVTALIGIFATMEM